MKTFYKYGRSTIISLFLAILLSACTDLDYENTQAINPDNVWQDKTMITAFLNDIYGGLMPVWQYGGDASDEGMTAPGTFSNFLRGILSVEDIGTGMALSYTYIDKINYFLSEIQNVPSSVLTDTEKNQLTGQALFWRAWDYWGKVTNLGGVPLILEPQDVTNRESLFVTRNKTSECVTQIIKDLDDAIANLPDVWDNANYGRITKGAAMALKGRILLWYASPLFNPSNDQTKWQNAYSANKSAVDYLKAQGKGLYPNYEELWYDERNKEVIMVNQFYYPDHTFTQNAMRPNPLTQLKANNNQPFLPLLSAFPKKDGSPLLLDIDQLQDPVYNAQYLTDFYMNRDDRFYTTIFCGGMVYPSADMSAGVRYWSVWKKVGDPSIPSGYISLSADQIGTGSNYGITGFFDIKGIDKSLAKATYTDAETDWIEIRFAEVLMNYGECANEVNKAAEALQVLYDIRERAGILEGNGKYGITATTQSGIREAYINERFVEFAFEGKRFGDLRRWKRFDILNNHQYRSGLYVVLNDGESVSNFNWMNDITDLQVRQKFHAAYIRSLDGSTEYKFNLSLNHWFFPLNLTDLNRNSKLEQNNEWGGTFNPLE